jgi:hypothetical protein
VGIKPFLDASTAVAAFLFPNNTVGEGTLSPIPAFEQAYRLEPFVCSSESVLMFVSKAASTMNPAEYAFDTPKGAA